MYNEYLVLFPIDIIMSFVIVFYILREKHEYSLYWNIITDHEYTPNLQKFFLDEVRSWRR